MAAPPAHGLLVSEDMNPSAFSDEDPGLDGPDYVTLVIEWNDKDDDEVTAVSAEVPAIAAPPRLARKIATVIGALVALALATWGLRRLRAV